jgi:DNA-binding PadR family transcriptional regulator
MTNYTALTAFKRDILWTLASEGPCYGLAIRNHLESRDYSKVHHGRLYPNLDDLAEMGLVEKDELDGRTNTYRLTTDARQMLQMRLAYTSQVAGDGQ